MKLNELAMLEIKSVGIQYLLIYLKVYSLADTMWLRFAARNFCNFLKKKDQLCFTVIYSRGEAVRGSLESKKTKNQLTLPIKFMVPPSKKYKNLIYEYSFDIIDI